MTMEIPLCHSALETFECTPTSGPAESCTYPTLVVLLKTGSRTYDDPSALDSQALGLRA